jgi:hypothetical protein
MDPGLKIVFSDIQNQGCSSHSKIQLEEYTPYLHFAQIKVWTRFTHIF